MASVEQVDVNGLWTVEFSTPGGLGTGVVVIGDGKIMGGDSNYYYNGNYNLIDSNILARLYINHYSGPLNNIFGTLSSITLDLRGAVGRGLIMAQGATESIPQQRASFRLRRVFMG